MSCRELALCTIYVANHRVPLSYICEGPVFLEVGTNSANPQAQREPSEEGCSLLEVCSQEIDDPTEQGTNCRSFLHSLWVLCVKQVLEL